MKKSNHVLTEKQINLVDHFIRYYCTSSSPTYTEWTQWVQGNREVTAEAKELILKGISYGVRRLAEQFQDGPRQPNWASLNQDMQELTLLKIQLG